MSTVSVSSTECYNGQRTLCQCLHIKSSNELQSLTLSTSSLITQHTPHNDTVPATTIITPTVTTPTIATPTTITSVADIYSEEPLPIATPTNNLPLIAIPTNSQLLIATPTNNQQLMATPTNSQTLMTTSQVLITTPTLSDETLKGDTCTPLYLHIADDNEGVWSVHMTLFKEQVQQIKKLINNDSDQKRSERHKRIKCKIEERDKQRKTSIKQNKIEKKG